MMDKQFRESVIDNDDFHDLLTELIPYIDSHAGYDEWKEKLVDYFYEAMYEHVHDEAYDEGYEAAESDCENDTSDYDEGYANAKDELIETDLQKAKRVFYGDKNDISS